MGCLEVGEGVTSWENRKTHEGGGEVLEKVGGRDMVVHLGVWLIVRTGALPLPLPLLSCVYAQKNSIQVTHSSH